jgi:heat shock protein beta-11
MVQHQPEGVTVIGTTSDDPNHAPHNILTQSLSEYWITTGMYPQEFIIRLANSTTISRVIITSKHVSEWEISFSNTDQKKWENNVEQSI